jgi:hypothetical protein
MFKFRVVGLSISIMLLALSFFSVTAQRGGLAPNPTAVPTAIPDRDGDGVPDSVDNCDSQRGPSSNAGCPEGDGSTCGGNGSGGNSGDNSGGNQATADTDGDGLDDPNDQCPTVLGTADNNGCPGGTEEPCPEQASTPSCEPTEPPRFPTDRCYVATAGRQDVNVRSELSLAADILGVLSAGNIYEAEIVLGENDEPWARLLDTSTIVLAHPADAGKEGYALLAALIFGNCPIPTVPGNDALGQDGMGDFVMEDTPLCYMALGFDADIWGAEGMQNVIYAYFWFASNPGLPIPEGTVNAGVIMIEEFIDFPNPESAYAVATDPSYFEEAQNAAYPGDYLWPTLAGGIQSGDLILPRIVEEVGIEGDGTGRCGPIVPVAPDDLSSNTGDEPGNEIEVPIDDLVCTVTSSSFIFAFAFAPNTPLPEGAQPIAILYPEPQEGSDLWEDPNLWSLIWHFDAQQYMYYEQAGYWLRLGGTCGDLQEPVVRDTAEIAPTEVPTVQRPMNQLACTVTTALGWVFAFAEAPGEPLDLGSHPLAVLQGHPDYSQDPAIWGTLQHDFNGHTVEYMGISREIDGWMELPRTGGTCGAIGSSEASVFVFPNTIGREDDSSLNLDRDIDFPDCNNNGENDLDEFWPPDCFGQLTTPEGDNVVEFPGFDDADTELAWLQCPDGWVLENDGSFYCSPLVVDDED